MTSCHATLLLFFAPFHTFNNVPLHPLSLLQRLFKSRDRRPISVRGQIIREDLAYFDRAEGEWTGNKSENFIRVEYCSKRRVYRGRCERWPPNVGEGVFPSRVVLFLIRACHNGRYSFHNLFAPDKFRFSKGFLSMHVLF